MKQKFAQDPKEIATRAASELALDALTAALPEMVGGADRRSRSGGDCERDRGREGVRPAVADRLPHHDRIRCAEQRRHRKEPRLGARTRGSRGRPADTRLERAAIRDSRRHPRAMARRRRSEQAGAARLGRTFRGACRRQPRRIRTAQPRRNWRCAYPHGRRFEAKVRARPQGDRNACRIRTRA